ncbi:MAG TPA: hypothetical protein VFK44_11265 [Bacillales bacterium]|nr:hypothetical protein [Bacillales bacterium]
MMFSLRGDAHKLYVKLKRTSETEGGVEQLEELKEISDIERFYQTVPSATLKKIRYRMVKERKGNGIVPILVTAAPWLAFILSDQLQKLLNKNAAFLTGFILLYSFFVTLSLIIHHREKAWAAVHVEIIEDLLNTEDTTRPSES